MKTKKQIENQIKKSNEKWLESLKKQSEMPVHHPWRNLKDIFENRKSEKS